MATNDATASQTRSAMKTNFREYGDPNPWSQESVQRVYQVLLDTDVGKEVRLTEAQCFENQHTGEMEAHVPSHGEIRFIFTDEWPTNDVLTVDGCKYVPAKQLD